MDKYIIVRVRDDRSHGHMTSVSLLRRALHQVSKDYDIELADMVTHPVFMTKGEWNQIDSIFLTTLGRAKNRHQLLKENLKRV